MRILHFINNENLSWYNMFLDTVRAQERRGHWVKAVVPPGGVNAKRLRADGVNVQSLPVRSSRFDLWAVWQLSRILRSDRVEVLHTHLTSSALLGAIASRWAGGIPCVASVLKITRKRRYMRCTRLLPCSDAVYEDMLRQGVPPERMRRVYTGIDFDRFFAGFNPRESVRGEFGWDDKHKVTGTIARLVPMKGHRVLVEAIPEVVRAQPQARFLIVGDGPLRGDLEQRVHTLGMEDKVSFTGTRSDLPLILNSIDVSVLASVSKEGLPIALVESALMRKPLVMSDVAGIREVVRDGETGYLVPPGDSKALAAAIVRALEQPEKAQRMAEEAYAFVHREFDVNYTAEQFDEEYRKAIVNY